jgi:hypothetical protein
LIFDELPRREVEIIGYRIVKDYPVDIKIDPSPEETEQGALLHPIALQ